MDYEERLHERGAERKRFTEIMEVNGIKIKIGGCGCCESPWVSMSYKGETIVDDAEFFSVDMFNE